MIRKLFSKYVIVAEVLLLCVAFSASAQTTAVVRERTIDYKSYMEEVLKQNIGYAVEKLNVSAAEANIKAAQIFNDPELSVEYADNDDYRMQMGRSYSAELSKTFSFGVRSANIDLARSEKELNEALLEDYLHSLRAEATLVWLEALKQGELYKIKESTYRSIRQLAESDSLRHALGKITHTDALQSRLEAGMIYNELLSAETELFNAYSSLSLWTGSFDRSVPYKPIGNMNMEPRTFDIEQLVQIALENRADLAAALKDVDVAKKELKVVRRERNPEFDLAIGYNYNTEVRNLEAPAPQFSGLTVGMTIPLKFSNLNRGAVKVAEYRMQQAELNYRQAELDIELSVIQSLNYYQATCKQIAQYDGGMLQDAEAVITGKRYSYQRGETSLLEVLDAQRTHDDLHSLYIETLYEYLAALVNLERSAGIWDIL